LTLDDFLSLLLSGLTVGSIYGMIGVSLAIAYKPTNVFNMAQGGFVMLGMMFAWGLLGVLGMPWLPGTIAVMAAVAVIGLVVERIAVAPVQKDDPSSHGWIVTTLAISIILVNLADQIWGADPRNVPPMPGTTLKQQYLGVFGFTTNQLAVIAVAVLSIGAIEAFYRGTRAGRAVLAVAEDRDGARLCGISPLLMTMGSFGAGAAYAAFTGVVAAPFLLASTHAGLEMLIKGFLAMAIGGLSSHWGTLLGGILIATIESLASGYLSPGFRQVLLLATFLTVLFLRPYGLFGKAAGREV
jgi:branched-chain amino acid transport system permease protein